MMACLNSGCKLAVALTFIFCLCHFADGGKLLVLPQDGSHWLSMQVVLEKLSQKGHKIVVVMPEISLLMQSSENFTVRTHSVPYTQEQLDKLYFELGKTVDHNHSLLGKIFFIREKLSELMTMFSSACSHFLYDKELVTFLQESNFDAMFMDPVLPCGPIIAEYLSLPSVYFMRGLPCGADYQAAQCPSPLSYIPRIFMSATDHMTFIERVKNVLMSCADIIFCHLFFEKYEKLASEFLQREITVLELFSRASIFLMRYDFVFEFPRPVMPNMVFIGGINCAQKKPLSQVLWRYTGEAPPNLAKNTKLVKWLPQNDLLAHPKARAFITHAGSHGIYEGICNGVPMVLMPLFGDQMDNAKRVESRGAGVTLNVVEMTSKDLSDALKAVIYDKQYKENIMHLSALHLDRPIHPLDLAVHWVEFVMKHKGAPHLRPAAHDLNWIQYHSLDVIAFLMAIALLALFISVKCCLFCCRKCFCKRGRLSKKGKSKSQ
ncbi:UDP-glucuronosyltransferase 1A1-like isoform X7 [Hemicordylus capensis]|uniref:UDP-glucuronosyltransferase 1A1-like isoform X7 n=1 Tax=Hemicordylus capensis TaxID=884348 RepID=UPI002304BFAC|nr:UDP-glucuronosyltransferase 1A1-like isoform X7 [Hemicordylus capensis]